jgi:hypothetical protein
MTSKYIIKKVQSESDMSLVLDVIWAANYDPYDPFVQLLFPILGYTPEAHKAAIVRTLVRLFTSETKPTGRP